ncbi:MAG: IclR family transcriptional regulator [Burkholderiaceae bacterium]|nr:IclR family transcriptional regulator [Burkholderiaceae bacterium]
MTEERRVGTVQSLEHGLKILVAVSAADRGLGITDLSRHLGLAKGSISRLVSTLARSSFLVRDPSTAKYRLSTRVWELGNKAVSRLDLRDIARPVMEELNRATGETTHITVLTEDGQMIFLDKVDSTRAIRPNVQLGAPHPPYCSANGKAMLAHQPEVRLTRLLNGSLRQYTPTTITRKHDLLAQLENVRKQGYAVNNGEYREDVSGIAAPVFDHTGRVVAALGVSVPSSRMNARLVRDLAPQLKKGARTLSLALGQHRDDAS